MWPNFQQIQKMRLDNGLVQNILLNAFPAALRQDVVKVIQILALHNHDVLIIDRQINNVFDLIHPVEQNIILDDESLKIPYRIYFIEPSAIPEKMLTDLQKSILNCIFLRHHNGFVRQRSLEKLIDKADYFVVPFAFQLLGEYVIEILEVLQMHINPNIDIYAKFINENPKYWRLTESRMISYWNEYYRKPIYPNYSLPKYSARKDYIGQRIVDILQEAIRHSVGRV